MSTEVHRFDRIGRKIAPGKVILATHAGTSDIPSQLAKMAVTPTERRHGIGRKLIAAAIAKAERLGATRLYLETNHTLTGAILLYESMGFRHVPPARVKPSHYARADVFMERMMCTPIMTSAVAQGMPQFSAPEAQ